MLRRLAWLPLIAAALALSGCSLIAKLTGGPGSDAVAGPPISPDTDATSAPFNNEPLAKSIVYGRTHSGNLHYRYFDRTTGVACVLEGVRGDVYVEYPTREQYLSTASEAQSPETFAQPVALDLVQGGNDLPLGITHQRVSALAPGGAADRGAGGILDLAIGIGRGFFDTVTGFLGLPGFGGGGGVTGGNKVRVVETYVRDGDLRCVLIMHSAQVDDTTRIAFKGSAPVAAPAPAPAAPAPAAPAAPAKK